MPGGPRAAAFLRSINVGGRRVTNAALIEVFESAGLTGVEAYQAAGNLVFTGVTDRQTLEAACLGGLGFEVQVLLRTLPEVAGIGAATPFSPAELAGRGKVQVGLLDGVPDASAQAAVAAMDTAEDRLELVGRELFWLPSAGVSDSSLDLASLQRLLGLQTWRTQGTLARFAKRFC